MLCERRQRGVAQSLFNQVFFVSTLKLLARFSGVAIEISRRKINKNPMIVMTSQVRGFLKCGRSKEEAFSFICKKYKLDWKFDKMNDVGDAIALGLYAAKHSDKD